MLIQVDDLKGYLGLPLVEDASADPVFERSILIAESLVSSYIGFSVEQDLAAQRTVTRHYVSNVKVVKLPHFPVKVTSVTLDGATLPSDQYQLNENLGMLEFPQAREKLDKLEIKYAPGFTAENLPADIRTALENIALGIYENGGRVAAASASGALKSLTMFDAMSMSFDTGSTSASAGTPEGIVAQWAFVLDKYRADKYVTA